jgi:CelD/BcsL family acetyltransferase involved in cellulose biosynthesis
MLLAPDIAPDMPPRMAGKPAIDDRWVELSGDVAEPNAFYMPELLRPALDHLADGGVHVVEAEEDGQLIGLLPVVTKPTYGRIPMAHTANWIHRHCFFGAPLLRKGQEERAWAGFLATLDDALWARGFLHLSGLDFEGPAVRALHSVCGREGRELRQVQSHQRALLHSDLDAERYWDTHVRAKKRKEIRRLQKRLAETGTVESRILADPDDLPDWSAEFLRLESAGWKGRHGTAIADSPRETAFFREALTAALAAGRLWFLRLDVDGKPVAMLVNFLHGAGSFSFKIAFDENMARFSPGVLIEIDNLRLVQSDPVVAWMDSCAAADHPMIDSLWAERRTIVQMRVALKGRGFPALRRRAASGTVNTLEAAAHLIRSRRA